MSEGIPEIDLTEFLPKAVPSVAEGGIFVEDLTPEILREVEASGEKMIFWYVGNGEELRIKGLDLFLEERGLWSSKYIAVYFSLEPLTLEQFKAYIIDVLGAPEGIWYAPTGHRTAQKAFVCPHDSRRYNCIVPMNASDEQTS